MLEPSGAGPSIRNRWRRPCVGRHADREAARQQPQRDDQSNCAVFRTGEVLHEGQNLIHKVKGGISDISVSDRSLVWNSDTVETAQDSTI